MISGILLAAIATFAMAEVKSSALIPKSLLLWPALVAVAGLVDVIQGEILLGTVLILCGIQALLVNLRRLSSWPSGTLWLGLILPGVGFQISPSFVQHVIGFLWMAIGITKVVRERGVSIEAGTPFWILLLYAEAILLASQR